MKALISVHCKDGIEKLSRELLSAGAEILSTGGTAQFLLKKDIKVTPIEHYTGSREVLDGRVKTLHPKIYSGLLARQDQIPFLKKNGIEPIDLIVVNLYPFGKMLGGNENEQLEYIDIGGVSLIRAAAKNFPRVHVLTHQKQYEDFCHRLKNKKLDAEYRKQLAMEAFRITSLYDSKIESWLSGKDTGGESALKYRKNKEFSFSQELKYGENPHQKASFHVKMDKPFEEILGRNLSYNNILDCDCAWRTCTKWKQPTVCIVKHATPCGIAQNDTLTEAYKLARACDSVSAFGGVVALNGTVGKEVALALKPHFLEVIVSPNFTNEAVEILEAKSIKLVKILSDFENEEIRSSLGGYLIQTRGKYEPKFQVVSQQKPDHAMKKHLLFAMKCCEEVKSNAIVLTHGYATVGIGGGMTSRVDAAELAIKKMKNREKNFPHLVMASDAFLPFPDVVELASQSGVKALIQPGGSKRDKDAIDAINKHGMVMVFTGIRHFRH